MSKIRDLTNKKFGRWTVYMLWLGFWRRRALAIGKQVVGVGINEIKIIYYKDMKKTLEQILKLEEAEQRYLEEGTEEAWESYESLWFN